MATTNTEVRYITADEPLTMDATPLLWKVRFATDGTEQLLHVHRKGEPGVVFPVNGSGCALNGMAFSYNAGDNAWVFELGQGPAQVAVAIEKLS